MKTKTTPFSSLYPPTTSNTEYWLIQRHFVFLFKFLILMEYIEGRSEDRGIKARKNRRERETKRGGKHLVPSGTHTMKLNSFKYKEKRILCSYLFISYYM